MLVNPLPLSVTSIAVITPPTTVASPNAPTPPPPVIRTETKLCPDPPLLIVTLFTLYVTSNVTPEPNAPVSYTHLTLPTNREV